MPEPHLRAADADRSAVADVLGAHLSAGRLTVEEYDQRLVRAWSARTYGELAELTADLPASPPHPAADSTPRPATRPVAYGPWWSHGWHGSGACAGGSTLRGAWTRWASTAVIVVAIWAFASIASADWAHPWPVWVIGPWGAVLLAQTLGGRRGGDDAPDTAGRRTDPRVSGHATG
jgi:hypothetical protein